MMPLLLSSLLAAGGGDATALVDPATTRLAGLLGRRSEVNIRGRLLQADENALLDGYRSRPGAHPWIGEHVGKFLHAGVLAWRNSGDAELKAKLDRVARELIACQEADGYLGTYDREHRWTQGRGYGWDVWSHKYCLAGLVTYHHYTGDEAALTAARRAADLLLTTFGRGAGQLNLNERSTHVGMASGSVIHPLVWLAEATGDRRYLDWCLDVIRGWDDRPGGPKLLSSLLAGKPVHETANGKAYEMMSCLAGQVATARALRQIGRAAEAEPLLTAARRAWADIAANRLYIDGAVSHREHFQPDGYFPNTGNLGETCANVTLLQFGLELFRLSADPALMDTLERTIYGHLLGAQQPETGDWCYYSGLEGRKPYGHAVNCSLSSGPRGVALLSTFAITADPDGGLRVNLLGPLTATLPTGWRVTLAGDYPYAGRLTLTVHEAPADAPLRVRVPGWAIGATVSVAGQTRPAPAGYLELRGPWRPDETVILNLPLDLRVVLGEGGNDGSLALVRGPVVLTADQALLPATGPLAAVTVANETAAELPLTVAPRTGEDYAGGAIFTLPGKLHVADGRELTLRLTDFAHAGASGTAYRVWLRRPTAPPLVTTPLTRESWSRAGNRAGSIVDGDPNTDRVTFDNTLASEDWYAVHAPEPVTVRRLVFVQGPLFHDGGWFDTSAGRPWFEVQERPDGPWRRLVELTDYSATTSASPAGLQPHQRFEITLPEPVTIIGLRLVGRPASGDNPRQAFSSCAELLAFGE